MTTGTGQPWQPNSHKHKKPSNKWTNQQMAATINQ